MIAFLERIRELRRPAEPVNVEQLTGYIDAYKMSIPELKAVLEGLEAEEKRILSHDLLDWMRDKEQVTFETEEFKVMINTYVSAKVIDDEAGFKWLEDRQYGNSIKDTLSFVKGEFSEEARKALEKLGLSYEQKRGIHHKSLEKIIRDRLLAGEDLPWSADDDIGDGIKVGYYDECVVKEK